MKCVACGGSGRSSKGGVCAPCGGTGAPKVVQAPPAFTLTEDEAHKLRLNRNDGPGVGKTLHVGPPVPVVYMVPPPAPPTPMVPYNPALDI